TCSSGRSRSGSSRPRLPHCWGSRLVLVIIFFIIIYTGATSSSTFGLRHGNIGLLKEVIQLINCRCVPNLDSRRTLTRFIFEAYPMPGIGSSGSDLSHACSYFRTKLTHGKTWCCEELVDCE